MKRVLCMILSALLILSLAGCGAGSGKTAAPENAPENAPEITSFALTWGCYGISSYDSATGKLVKTTDATHPEDYVTEYRLTEQERQEIWQLLRELDANSYPDAYDPNPELGSDPTETLILTVRTAAGEKTITARDTAFASTAESAEGRAFLQTCRTIERLLTGTEAWQALPDYEHYYL